MTLKKLGAAAIAVAAVLALAAGGMWITGGGDGRWQHHTSISISRPASEVFPWLVEPDRLMQWLGGLREITPLTEGDPRVGARSRDVVESHGERFDLETTITEFDPPRLLSVRVEGEAFTMAGRYELERRNGATELTYTIDTQFDGFFFALFEPVIGVSAERKIDADLARLKAAVESTRPAAPGA